MDQYLLLVLQSLWYIFPAYIANPVPVIAGGGTPMDFGRKFYDKRPLLGSGKTWRGAIAGIIAGTLVAYFQGMIGESYGLSALGFTPMTVKLGLLLSAGTIFGDTVKSFFKRRLGYKPGQKMFLADQLDFLFGALLFASFDTMITIRMFAVLLIITPITHRLTNVFAYRLGLKKVPW